jgi:hypothetical protein
MSITYSWEFPQVEVVLIQDNLENVIQTVHWRLTATDGQYTASCYGSVGLDKVVPENFTIFDEISKSQVEEWVTAKINGSRQSVDDMKQGLAHNITLQQEPKTVSITPSFS